MKLLLTSILTSFYIFCSAQTAQEYYDVALVQMNEGATVKDVFGTLDLCLQADSTYENAYFLKAYVFYKLKAFDEAIEEYNKLMRFNPYHREALKNRALTKIQLFDLEGAIEDHNRRLALEPHNAAIYHDRAYCKGLQQDFAGSIEDYTRALELDPTFKEAYANRGKAKMNLVNTTTYSTEMNILEDACIDLNMAKKMGDTSGLKLLSTHCAEIAVGQ